MTNIAQTTTSAGDDHHFTRGLQALVFGVDGGVNVTVHALRKLEGGSELIGIDWTLCHFGAGIMIENEGVDVVTQWDRRMVELGERG